MAIDENQRQGTRGGYDNTSPTNQINFLVKQQIRKDIQTNLIARIDTCESTEENAGAKTVSITPLISQTDTEGTALEMVSIPKIPHTRYQHGIAAVIIDPVPNDIVAVSINKNDISTINDQTTEPVNAGSFRQFSQSDAVVHDSIHTKTPEVYIVLRQDKTIKERGPEGIRVETDKTLDEEALENRLIHIGQNKEEQIDANHTQTIKGTNTITIDGDSSDISTINDQTTEPVNAGSFRQFSQSDAVVHDSIHTKTPEVYIVLRQDKTIKERGPEGIRVETDKTLDEEALENRLIHIGQNKEEQIDANHTQTIKGTNTITIDGDSSITIKSNSSHKVSGNISINADGSINVKAGGSITVEAGGSITLKAPSITFDTPQASFTGNVSIAGGLSQGGGMRSANTRSSNGAVFYNDIHTLRTITADIDAIGGGISLKGHVHSGVKGGPDTTGGPQ